MCYFVFFLFVVYCIVLCIVVPLPPGTCPLAVNNNNYNLKNYIISILTVD